MSLNVIRAVGFDLDDTLYDRDDIYRQVFEVMEKTVIKTSVAFEQFNRIYQEESIAKFTLYNEGKISKEAYQFQRVVDTYLTLGIHVSQDEAMIFNALYQYIRTHAIRLRPGVEEVLDYLKEQGIELFILTNGPSQNQWQKIESLHLNDWFSKTLTFVSGDYGFAKPQREIFERVQSQLTCQPDQVLYIGDNYEKDVVASLRNGWQAIYYDFQELNSNPLEVIRVTNFDNLMKNLHNLIG